MAALHHPLGDLPVVWSRGHPLALFQDHAALDQLFESTGKRFPIRPVVRLPGWFVEVEILGSCVYTPADFAKSVGLLAEKQVDLLLLVSHRVALVEGIGAIEQMTKGMDAQKVLLAVS